MAQSPAPQAKGRNGGEHSDNPKKIVIMNHTNMLGHHFGCARVMRLLENGLTVRGCQISGRLDGKLDWRNDNAALAKLEECDTIVINGEGTLHHGRKKAGWLMSVAAHEVTRDKEIALVNALFQANPNSWVPLVQTMEHLYCRDSRSAAELSRMAGRDVTSFGDLSTSEGALPDTFPRSGVVVGDSVKRKVRNSLYNFARELSRTTPTQIAPITASFRELNPYKPLLRRFISRKIIARRQKMYEKAFPLLQYPDSEEDYLRVIRQCRLSVTGRFHGVCLNLVTGTPFLCIFSNSWKIEALFEDVGLSFRRLIDISQLNPNAILNEDWGFSEIEQRNIASFLDRSSAGANRMFDAISGYRNIL